MICKSCGGTGHRLNRKPGRDAQGKPILQFQKPMFKPCRSCSRRQGIPTGVRFTSVLVGFPFPLAEIQVKAAKKNPKQKSSLTPHNDVLNERRSRNHTRGKPTMAAKTLQDLIKEVTADGKISAAEVSELRQNILADGKVDRKEADALFDANDKVSGAANDPSWPKFFSEAITQHLMEDGKIDDDEASWLLGKIDADGQVDETERTLLKSIRQSSTHLPAKLDQKLVSLGI